MNRRQEREAFLGVNRGPKIDGRHWCCLEFAAFAPVTPAVQKVVESYQDRFSLARCFEFFGLDGLGDGEKEKLRPRIEEARRRFLFLFQNIVAKVAEQKRPGDSSDTRENAEVRQLDDAVRDRDMVRLSFHDAIHAAFAYARTKRSGAPEDDATPIFLSQSTEDEQNADEFNALLFPVITGSPFYEAMADAEKKGEPLTFERVWELYVENALYRFVGAARISAWLTRVEEENPAVIEEAKRHARRLFELYQQNPQEALLNFFLELTEGLPRMEDGPK